MESNLLTDSKWRGNNLFYVIDEFGSKVDFNMCPEQEDLYDNMRRNDLVPKARVGDLASFSAVHMS